MPNDILNGKEYISLFTLAVKYPLLTNWVVSLSLLLVTSWPMTFTLKFRFDTILSVHP